MDVDVGNLETNQDDEAGVDEWAPQEFTDHWLDEEKVAEARAAEIKYMRERGMFVPSTRVVCVAKTGTPPITSTRFPAIATGCVGDLYSQACKRIPLKALL